MKDIEKSSGKTFVLELPFYEIEQNNKYYRNSVTLCFNERHWWGLIYSWEKGNSVNYASMATGKRKHKTFWKGIVKFPFFIEPELVLSSFKKKKKMPEWMEGIIDICQLK